MLCVLEQRMTHHLIFKEHCWAFDGFHPFHLWSRVKPSTPPPGCGPEGAGAGPTSPSSFTPPGSLAP